MKTIFVTLAMILGAVSAEAATVNCKTPGGRSASFTITSNAISNGQRWIRANGQSATSFYYRDGFGTTVIVNKSVLQGNPGRIVWMVERNDEPDTRKVFYCNQ